MRTSRLAAYGVLVLLLARAAPAPAEDAETRHADAWRQAQTAVAEFAVAQLQHPRGAQRSAALKQARDRYETVLSEMKASPPPQSLILLHWELVLLSDELLAGMSTVVDGETSGDTNTIELGWAWIEQVRSMMRTTLREARPPAL